MQYSDFLLSAIFKIQTLFSVNDKWTVLRALLPSLLYRQRSDAGQMSIAERRAFSACYFSIYRPYMYYSPDGAQACGYLHACRFSQLLQLSDTVRFVCPWLHTPRNDTI